LFGRKKFKLVIVDAQALTPPSFDVTAPDIHVWRDQYGSACAYGHTVGGYHWMHLPELASFRFNGRSEEVLAVSHPAVSPVVIRDAYYRSLLPMALQALGLEGLHASGVRMPQGVIAFCGQKESGKSTIAFALNQRGHALWADDTVTFEVADGAVNTIPLPFQIRLRPAAASFLGQACPTASPTGDWDGADWVGVGPAPLAAVCVLHQVPHPGGKGPVEAARLSASQALLTVLPHAHCFGLQDAGRKRRMMQQYLELIEQVPVLDIRMQTGLENLSAVVNGIEDSVKEVLSLPRRIHTRHAAGIPGEV
jgi:hypothetical protein